MRAVMLRIYSIGISVRSQLLSEHGSRAYLLTGHLIVKTCHCLHHDAGMEASLLVYLAVTPAHMILHVGSVLHAACPDVCTRHSVYFQSGSFFFQVQPVSASACCLYPQLLGTVKHSDQPLPDVLYRTRRTVLYPCTLLSQYFGKLIQLLILLSRFAILSISMPSCLCNNI